ncbi:MAG: winged helix-turn-helix domain-containing protein [Acidobacteria bacterium]|nr:winged helix-turn-helix domain-containing protein [Acidobacteriota bacterium]
MSHVYRFGEFELVVEDEILRKNGKKIGLSRRAFQVLLLLVERSGEIVTKQDFFDTVWGDTFVEDNSLTVAMTAIRKALGDDPKQPIFIENLPRKGYRFIAEVKTGNDKTDVREDLAEKPQKQIEANKSEETRISPRKRALPIGIAAVSFLLLVVLGFTYLGRETFSSSVKEVDRIDSIAVLPFSNEDAEIEYISDGLTETIINNLARLPGLRVTSRNSVFQYKGKDIEAGSVGTELNVRAILTGRLVKTGDDLLISVELTDLKDNRQVWGQQYLRKPDDVYFVQQQISHEIAKTLRSKLSEEETKRFADDGTDNPEAFRSYIKGAYYLARRDDLNYDRAIDQFNLAIDKDPAFALPYVGLAKAFALMSGDSKYQPKTDEERNRIVIAYGQKALEIDPDLSEAHAAMGLNSLFLSATPQWAKAEHEYRKAIELNPNNAQARHWLAEYLALVGKYEESFAEYDRAIVLDPLSMAVKSDRCYAFYFARQFDRSINCFQELIDKDPSFSRNYWFIRHAYMSVGRYDDAIEANRIALLSSPVHAGYAENDARDLQKGVAANEKTGFWNAYLQMATRWESDWEIAIAYSNLGDTDKAFQHLNKDIDRPGSGNAEYLTAFPHFDPLHNDPRWQELLKKIGR